MTWVAAVAIIDAMWRQGAFSTVAAVVGAVALALAGAVIQSNVGRALDDFPTPAALILFFLSIVLISGAAFEPGVARRRDRVVISPDVSQPKSIEQDRKVAYHPALSPWAVVAVLFCAGWLVCWVLTLTLTKGRWSAELCYESDPYNCSDHWGLAALFVIGMVIGSALALAVGGHRWRVRMWPARRKANAAYLPPPTLEFFGWGALASGFLITGIWSAILGATRYVDNRPLVAVGFVFSAIGAPIVLAALSRIGYVWTLRNQSVMLTTQRHYPYPPTPRTPTATERIVDTATKRFLRSLGKTVQCFEPDPWFGVLDTLALIPSVRTFTLAGWVTMVVAGRRVAVLACAQWPPGRYARHGETSVTRDGQPYHDSHSTVAEAIKALDWLSRNVPTRAVVRAFIIVTTEANGVVEFDNDTDELQLVGAADGPAVIRSFLAEQRHVVDRRVALAVWLAGPHLTGSGF